MIPNPIRTRSATLNTTNTPSQAQSQLTQNERPFQLEKDGSYSEHSSASNIMNILSDGEDGGFVTSPSGIQTDGQNVGHVRYNHHGRNIQQNNGLALPLQKTRSDNFVNTTTQTPNNSKTDIYAHSQRANKFPHIKNGNNNERAQNGKAKHFSPYQNMHSQPNHRNYKFDMKKGIFKGDNNDNHNNGFGKEYGLSAQSYRDRDKSPGITPLSLAMPKSCGHTPQSSVNAATLWQNMGKLKKTDDLIIDTFNALATTPNGDSARCDCDTKYDGDDDEEEDTTSHRTCMIHGNTPIRSANDDALNMSVNMHINDPGDENDEHVDEHGNHVNMNENDVAHIYESLSSHDNEASPTFNLISKITNPVEMNPRSKPQTPSRKRKALQLLGISSNESTPSNFNHSFSYNGTFSRRNNLRNYSSYSSKSKSKSSKFLNSKKDKDGSKKSRGISLRNKLSKSKSTKSMLPKSSQSRPTTLNSNNSGSKSKSKRNQNHHHQNKINHNGIPDGNPQFGGPKQPMLTHSTSQHSSRQSSRPTSQYSSRPNTARSIQSVTRSNRSKNALIQQKTNIQHHKSSNVISSKSPQQTQNKTAFRLHGARSNGHTPQSINDKSPNATNHVSRGWFFDYKNNNNNTKSIISNASPHSMNRGYYGSSNALGSPNANGSSNTVIINNVSNISTKHEYYRSQGVNGMTRGYSGNTPKSFSKTLTQSELRDIVYEENDVILMEAIKNSKLTPNSERGNSPNGHHLHLGTHSGNMMDILSLKHTNSNSGSAHQHNNTIFVSNSYHRDNVLSANNNTVALNKRIFELLALNNTTCGTLESSDVLYDEEEEHTPLDMVTNSNQLQTASVPPKMDQHAYGTSNEPPPFDSNPLHLQKAFSLPNDQHTNINDTTEQQQIMQYNKPKLKGKNNTITGTVSTNQEIGIHYECNDIDQKSDDDDEPTVSRLKLIGIPSQVDDIVVDIGKIQDMNRSHHKKNRSTSTKSKFSRTGAGNTSITTDNGHVSLQDLDYETEDDQTLNTEMLILGRASPSPNPRTEQRHVRNGTNATITFNNDIIMNNNKSNHKSSQDEMTTDFEDIEEEKQLHTNECDDDHFDIKEEDDFFPAPKDYNKDKKRKHHHSSRSLLDELGRFAGIFHQSSKLSMSFSSKSQNKSIKPRRLTNESVNKRRSRSMPSIDGIEELNGHSTDSIFDHHEQTTNDDDIDDDDEEEEKGDIVSLLSVLVKHGFYTKTNLNSVQQLTTYAKQ